MLAYGSLTKCHVGCHRPELETYKYDMPGEDHVTQNELFLFDIETLEGTVIDEGEDAWTDQTYSIPTVSRHSTFSAPSRSPFLRNACARCVAWRRSVSSVTLRTRTSRTSASGSSRAPVRCTTFGRIAAGIGSHSWRW